MKKISTLLFGIVFSITILNSQVAPPQAFSFKASIKDKYGLPVILRKINLRITVLQSDMNGFPVYSEYFKPTTDLYSQVDVQIGQGTVISGNFLSIEWSANKYFLKIEVDINGGTNYQLLSVTQLLSVPYALYAGKSGSAVIEADPVFSLHPARGITSLNISNWNTAFSWGNHAGLYKPLNYSPVWGEINNNPFNITNPSANQLLKYNGISGRWENWTPDYLTVESQNLSIEGDVLSLTNGGSVKLPASAAITGLYFYADRDNDNYGDPFSTVWVPAGVTPPLHFVTQLDCNDGNSTVHPGAAEICGDGVDQDCNGSDLLCSGGTDNDKDGYTVSQGDCDDNNSAIHPGAAEICDGKDNDCNSQIDEGCVSCASNSDCPSGQCVNGFCAGGPVPAQWQSAILNRHNYYRAEVGVSPFNWSDQLAQQSQTWAEHLLSIGQLAHSYTAGVNENVGSGLSLNTPEAFVDLLASEKSNYNPVTGMCNNGNFATCGHYLALVDIHITNVGCGRASGSNGDWYYVCQYTPMQSLTQRPYPDADFDEITDNADNCPNIANHDQKDTDGDGIGDVCDSNTQQDKDGDGYSVNQGDCDDNNAAVHPGATEVCDGLDNNCNGSIDEDLTAPLSNNTMGVCVGFRKICDGANGWKEPDYSTIQGYQNNETICDGMDNDCDGLVDEGCTSCTNNSQCPNGQCVNGYCVTTPDQDNDGDGYKTSQGDCDDNNPSIHPGASEIIGDGIDQDCNGTDETNAPTSFDWRNVNGQNWMTPVKNQGQCGSCYAVATVAAFEAKIKIQSNNPSLVIDLSEQEIVSCSTAFPNQGCNGGNPGIVLNYIRDNGIVEESFFPYTSGTGSAPGCISLTGQKKYKIDGYETITSLDPDVIKKALINKGPMIFLTYSDNSLMDYHSGIFNPSNPGQSPNKTMLLVGYDDAGGYWIVENTWGTWWGESGFYKLGYASTAALGTSKYVINNAINY